MPRRRYRQAAVRKLSSRIRDRRQQKKTKAQQFAEKFKANSKNRQAVFLLTHLPANATASNVARFLGVAPARVNRIEHVINAANLITSLEAAKRLDLPFTPQVSLAVKELMQVKPKGSQKLVAKFKRFAKEEKKQAIIRAKARRKGKRKGK